MRTHPQRGSVHILLLAVLVLVTLGVIARCDIEHAKTDPAPGPDWENRHAPDDANRCRSGNNLDRADPLQ